MDEKIQQLTSQQLLDVIVFIEENKIVHAIEYILSHTTFQYDDAQEIVTELTKRYDTLIKVGYGAKPSQRPTSTMELKQHSVLASEGRSFSSPAAAHSSLEQQLDSAQQLRQLHNQNQHLWIFLAVVVLILSFVLYWL